MVSIHDALENAFVFERVASYGWIGFGRPDTGKDWYWTDGTPANWTNWCAGQPKYDGERFAVISAADNGCWHTANVTGYTYVVCKVPEQAETNQYEALLRTSGTDEGRSSVLVD